MSRNAGYVKTQNVSTRVKKIKAAEGLELPSQSTYDPPRNQSPTPTKGGSQTLRKLWQECVCSRSCPSARVEVRLSTAKNFRTQRDRETDPPDQQAFDYCRLACSCQKTTLARVPSAPWGSLMGGASQSGAILLTSLSICELLFS